MLVLTVLAAAASVIISSLATYSLVVDQLTRGINTSEWDDDDCFELVGKGDDYSSIDDDREGRIMTNDWETISTYASLEDYEDDEGWCFGDGQSLCSGQGGHCLTQDDGTHREQSHSHATPRPRRRQESQTSQNQPFMKFDLGDCGRWLDEAAPLILALEEAPSPSSQEYNASRILQAATILRNAKRLEHFQGLQPGRCTQGPLRSIIYGSRNGKGNAIMGS